MTAGKFVMTVAVGLSAPDFTLQGIDGKSYSLRQAVGNGPTLLVIFKAGCGACDLAFPYINRLAEAYDGEWKLWAIGQEPADRATDYAKKHGMNYPVLLDTPGYPVSKIYEPPGTPSFYLLSPDGTIRLTTHGFSKEDLNEISRVVASYLGVEPQEIASQDDGRPPFRPG